MKKIMMITAAAAAVMVMTACGQISAGSVPDGKTAGNAAARVSAEDDKEYVYCVGSVSKIYVTAAIMQLADEGRIDIEKPVTEYIPDFRMADERYRDITVRMLMDHTSGIMGSTWKNNILYNDRDTYNHDHLTESLSSQRLKADPGKFSSYCNDGFDLLAIIVENVSGMDYSDYIRENISERAGLEMTGTGFEIPAPEYLVPSVRTDNIRLETEYSMILGTGGDICHRFG